MPPGDGVAKAAKRVVRALVPPAALAAIHHVRARSTGGAERPEWEYVPEGWARARTDAALKGWNVEGVLETYKRKWPSFLAAVEGTGPLGVSHESSEIVRDDFWAHNTIVSYAYVLARTAHGAVGVQILDWGGGIGHYYVVSRVVLPEVDVFYHCRDVPLLCEHGRTLFPEARFYVDDTCFQRSYDLVLASSSLQYCEEWRPLLQKLASAATRSLYLARVPIVFDSPSFVVLQRAYGYGYQTEYLGWVFNRDELLDAARAVGMTLEREFVFSREPLHVTGAEKPVHERGFLFHPALPSDSLTPD